MEDYIISIDKIEELQMLKDIYSLDDIFLKARLNLNRGGNVILERKNSRGPSYKVEEIIDLDDFEKYRQSVYKYL